MEAYEEQIRIIKNQIDAAEEREDEITASRLKERLRELRKAYREVRDRVMQRRSTGMMVSGIVISGIGGAGVVTALALGVVSFSNSVEGKKGNDFGTPALIALLGGAACAAIGVPLAVAGSKRVPRDTRGAPVRPTLLLGPGMTGLRVQF